MWKQRLGLWIVTLIQFIQILKGQNVTCAEKEFTCRNGECILIKWRCDGETDCFDHSDEIHCESYPSCSSNEFQCNTTKACVQASWRCDGDNDCGDYSDELNCNHPECTEGEYRCANGYCINESYECDGDIDCHDSSDEALCGMIVRCKEDQFQCDSRQCIHIDWQCDDEDDCSNGKDEVNCTNCHPKQWKCGSGECIPERHRCDKDPDCRDRSDEIGCGNSSTSCQMQSDFHCTTGECVNSELVCDGVLDCIDGTDEHNCSKDKDDCESKGSGENNCSTTAESNSTNMCLQTQYRCWNDQCIEQDKVCNRVKDCEDGSDEFKCPTWENQTSCGMNRGGCQHLCHDYRSTFKCSCHEGFKTDPIDSKRCKDINECEMFGFCSQMCINGHGSYNCSCLKGYALQSDKRKCKALGSRPLLLLSSEDQIQISALQSPNKMQTLMRGLKNGVAVDYYLDQNLVFWTDTILQTIASARLNGTMIKNVVTFGLERPCGLAVDWLGMKIFWADSGSGRIEMSNFDGTQRKAIYWVPLGKLRAIALHPSKGYIFWTEWDVDENYCNKSSITRANMDGTEVKRIIYQGICWPNALAVDYAIQRIFYVDSKEGLIESSDFEGKKLRPVMRTKLLYPFSISIFEDTLYWTDSSSNTIFKANKFDGRDFRVVKRNVKSPMGIAVLHTSRQQRDNYNCGNNNGGCSHICLPTSSGRSCACPTGFKLLNSTRCSEKIDKFVAYVGDFVVRQISLDTDDMLDVVLPFESVLDVFAMDWDPVEDEMYWADSNNDEITIRKGKMRTPYRELVVHKVSGKLSGIGVDWLSRKLYWSDEEKNQILVSNLDGGSATVVVWRKNLKPRNLLLHVEKRYMYWTSHGRSTSINRAGMDGFSREKLVSNGLVNPTDLTLNKAKNLLYWVDGGNIVYFVSLTTRKRNFFRVSHHSKKLHPFSIGVYKDRFFWADSNLKKVLSIKLGHHNIAKVIGKFKSNPVRLAVFQQVEKEENHPCAFNNSGCSHLCLLSPSNHFRCACPAGRRLKADNKTCETVAEVSRFVLVNSDGQLYQVPLSVAYKTNIMIASEGNKNIFAFDVDVKHRTVYFIKKTTEKKEICYVSLSGGSNRCFFSDILHAPGDIAYDPGRHYIYWTDFLAKKIYLAKSKGKFWTVVVWKNLDLPSSITVAYKDGFIFWADLGKQVSISRSNMDGTSQLNIVTAGLKIPNSLTIDHTTKHLYWTDHLQQRIELCDFEGKNRRQFASTVAGPTSLTLFSRFVYWSEWDSNVLKKSGKTHEGLAVTVMKGLKRVTGIQAVNLRKIPVSKSMCGQSNGNCSHFCLKNPAGVSCACPVGVQLQDDGKTCYDSPNRSIYYSSGERMVRISMDTDDLTGFPLPNIYVNITAFDITANYIYWTDGTRIFSTLKNASDTKTIITVAMSSIKSLVVDWTSGNLFWTDLLQAKIKVSNSNGSISADLVSDGLKSPSDIAIDPVKGLLFWTDVEKKVIESSHADGRSRRVIASKDIHSPVGLTVEVDTEFLYWADVIYHTIERCSYNGQRRLSVVKKDVHAFGLAILGSHLYWTDKGKRALLRADKEKGDHPSILEEDLEIPMGIAALSREKRGGKVSCFINNGNCSGLCLPTPSGRSCASVCDGKLHLNDSCDIQEIVIKPTIVKSSISCSLRNDKKNCSGGSEINFSKEKRTAKIAYIVGGIVFLAFIITMSVLVYLCQRRLKTVLNQSKQKELTPFRVSFENRHTTNKGDSVNDPLVIITSKPLPDQTSTTSGQSSDQKKFAVIYKAKNQKETIEESQCLTISNV